MTKVSHHASRRQSIFIRYPIIWLINLICLFALVFVSIMVWRYLQNPEQFPIQQVIVKGEFPAITEPALEQIILPYTEFGFFHINVDKLQQALLDLSWTSDVSVRKVWPAKIIINITMYQPVAIWDTANLLAKDGTVFKAAAGEIIPENLPQLQGPDGLQQYVLQSYFTMSEMLAPLGISIADLRLTARMAWYLILSNGIQINLDSIDPMSRLQRFVTVYPIIIGNKANQVSYVDTRYSNGIAVKWKTNV